MSADNYLRANFKRFQEKSNQCGVTVQPLLNSPSQIVCCIRFCVEYPLARTHLN